MKICQLCAVDFTLYHLLLPLMNELKKEGHEVVGVCAAEQFKEQVEEKGFRVETIDFERNLNIISHIKSFFALIKLFKKEKFDVIHTHTPVASLMGRFAAFCTRTPVVMYTAHGFYFHEHMPFFKRAFFIFLEWLAGRTTDILFTQNIEDAVFGRKYFLCKKNNVHAIGNGVDQTIFHPKGSVEDKKKLRQQYNCSEDDVIILCVGRLIKLKGFVELIEAMKSIDAKLWIVGERLDSDHDHDIDAAIQLAKTDSSLKKKISFLGYRGDVADLMRATDIYTLPSYREGMPRSIIEAMSCAQPVVASNIRGSREEIVDGETGFLVPIKNPKELSKALNKLVKDKDLREKMGKASYQRAKNLFDESLVIKRQLHFFDNKNHTIDKRLCYEKNSI